MICSPKQMPCKKINKVSLGGLKDRFANKWMIGFCIKIYPGSFPGDAYRTYSLKYSLTLYAHILNTQVMTKAKKRKGTSHSM